MNMKSKQMNKVVHLIGLLLLPFAIFSQENSFPTGVVIDTVTCLKDASHSYAMYLPKGYDSSKKWPALFIFEPAARGKLPVELYAEAAEKYGYIVVSSNNSKNGIPWGSFFGVADTFVDDVLARFSVNQKLFFTVR